MLVFIQRSLAIQIVGFLQSEILMNRRNELWRESLTRARNCFVEIFKIDTDNSTQYAGSRLLKMFALYMDLELDDLTKRRFANSIVTFIIDKMLKTMLDSHEYRLLAEARYNIVYCYGIRVCGIEPSIMTIFAKLVIPESTINIDLSLWAQIVLFLRSEMAQKNDLEREALATAIQNILRIVHVQEPNGGETSDANFLPALYNTYLKPCVEAEGIPRLIESIINFILDHLLYNGHDTVIETFLNKSVECLKSVYDIDSFVKNPNEPTLLELYAAYITSPVVYITPLSLTNIQIAQRYHGLGNIAMTEEKYTIAVKCYSSAIHLQPFHYLYYYSRGVAYHKLEMILPAIRDLYIAFVFCPGWSKIYCQIGEIFEGFESFVNAEKFYAIAIQMEPENEEYHYALRRIRQQIDEFTQI